MNFREMNVGKEPVVRLLMTIRRRCCDYDEVNSNDANIDKFVVHIFRPLSRGIDLLGEKSRFVVTLWDGRPCCYD